MEKLSFLPLGAIMLSKEIVKELNKPGLHPDRNNLIRSHRLLAKIASMYHVGGEIEPISRARGEKKPPPKDFFKKKEIVFESAEIANENVADVFRTGKGKPVDVTEAKGSKIKNENIAEDVFKPKFTSEDIDVELDKDDRTGKKLIASNVKKKASTTVKKNVRKPAVPKKKKEGEIKNEDIADTFKKGGDKE